MASEGGETQGDVFLPGSLVPRRLAARLDGLVDGKIALIVAPAGYHKTALVHHWVTSRPELDERTVRIVLRTDRPIENLDALHGALARIPAGGPKYVWVDNLDRMPANLLHALLDVVESNADLRLMMAGRTRPNLALSAWALRGQLLEIGADELALTRDELRALTSDRDTPEAALDVIMDMYRGWPIAVDLLLTRRLTWAQVPAIEATIDGYIEEEVLGELEPSDLTFLQDLAALPELTPAAATHLTGRHDAGAQLARLAAAGVPLEWDAGNVIRFNPAVRRYLQRTLQHEDPDRLLAQNRKAASWLRARGRPEDALHHAASSNDVELAFDLLVEMFVARLGKRDAETASWFAELTATLPPHYLVGLGRTVMLSVTHPGSVGLQSLRTLRTQMPAEPSDNDLARFYTVTLAVARVGGYAKDQALIDEAVGFAREVAAAKRSCSLLDSALVLSELGQYCLEHGLLNEGADVLQQVAANAQIIGMIWLSELAQGCLAFIESLRGNALTARRLAEEALRSAEASGSYGWMRHMPLLTLADVARDRGELEPMGKALEELLDGRPSLHLPGHEAFRVALVGFYCHLSGRAHDGIQQIQTFRIGFADRTTGYQRHLISSAMQACLVAVGDLAAAERELANLEFEGGQDMLDVRHRIIADRARLSLAKGDAAEAYALTLEAIGDTSAGSRDKTFLYVIMMHGVAASQLGKGAESLAAFQRAGILAERLGVAVPGALHTRTAASIRRDQVDLTPAEKQVLQHLLDDTPLADIASALFISPNTLKTHLRRIYKKLGASGRQDAIERAKSMGLL